MVLFNAFLSASKAIKCKVVYVNSSIVLRIKMSKTYSFKIVKKKLKGKINFLCDLWRIHRKNIFLITKDV